MKQLHLYIGSQEVEFSSPPDILYTYQQDDLTNPTIVKNSFSKTITIEGTPANNQLFGHYWNVERLQGNNGNGEGVYFNASKKAPFTLYLDHDIYETGYAKLDSISTMHKTIQYSISLFGGLGDFFYNLSINSDGDQLKLSDLVYMPNGGSEEFDFTANIDTVKSAWDSLRGGTQNKWQYINFMPAYNGFPEDFDSDKVIINTEGTSLRKSVYNDGISYSTRDGFSLGTLPEEMTEWETRDLRSYLQRPCIRMKEIVNACCNPDNNGGYNVVLDPDFFNSNNPYWEKTWLTLPMVQNLEYSNDEQILEGATLVADATTGDSGNIMYQDLEFSLGEFSQTVPSRISVSGRIKATSSFSSTSYAWFWNRNGDSYHSGWWCLGSLFCQLIAMNGDTVVGASSAYNLTTPIRHNGKLYYGHNGRYSGSKKFSPYMDRTIYDVFGTFGSNGFVEEDSSSPRTFTFTISNLQSNVTALKMVYFWGATNDKIKKMSRTSLINKTKDNGWTTMDVSSSPVSMENLNIINLSSNVKAVMGGSLGRTGTRVSKALLLNTENSPCDYLLSYTKMFGLYYTKDATSNTIYIQTRKSFYDRSDIVDLNDLIDKGRDITITPIAFDTKWYQFKQEYDETQFYSNYMAKRGVEYGSKILNTGYEFNAEKKQLLEENVIKAGIEGLEKSKYFTAYDNDNVIRPWFGYGLKYNLYRGSDTYEMTASTINYGTVRGINEQEGLKYFDVFPKLQFHNSDNSGTEGKDCLVFFSGMKEVTSGRSNPLSYYLTDDTVAQTLLNEGTPCWLFTTTQYNGGVRIAYKLSDIPVFERYLTTESSGKVARSLDFGSAQELFNPSYSLTDDTNIYHNFWKTYLEDLYDVNTKVLKCYAKVEGKPNPDWLRRFYWFDNSIWRLNKITDWNISSFDTTQMEFVKVQDIANYTSITQTKAKAVIMTSNKYNVQANGDTATLTLTLSDGGDWRVISTSEGLTLSSTSGTGNSTITATFAQNNTDEYKPYYITAIDEDGNTSRLYISQDYANSTTLSTNPSALIVPSDGGLYNIDFEWFNQGANYVSSYSVTGSVDASADLSTSQAENDAAVTIGSNTGTTAKSGAVVFAGGGYQASTTIDQLPASVSFESTGGTYTLTLAHTSAATFSNVPSWLSVVNNGDCTYTFTASNNPFDNGIISFITISNGTSQAEMTFIIDAGTTPTPVPTDSVTPSNLYFDATGGTQFVNVDISDPWVCYLLHSSFVRLSSTRGDGSAIIGVTVGENTGSSRSMTLNFINQETNDSYSVGVSQMGSGATQSISVSPSSTSVPQSGGTYTATINYTNRNGDYVSISGSSTDTGITWGSITWNEDLGTVEFTIGPNSDVNQVDHAITFESSLSPVTIHFIQDALTEIATLDTAVFNVNGDSHTISNGITSNVSWIALTNYSWLHVSPATGNSGYTEISISVSAASISSSRSGTIEIYSDETQNLLATITVNQERLVETITTSPASVVFDASGGTATFTITSNTSWTINGND